MSLQQYGIFSPAMGVREDVPHILLNQAYLAEGSQNVQSRYGEIYRARMPQETLLITMTDYSAATTYCTGQLAFYSNKTWKSKVDSNQGNTPAEDANWTEQNASELSAPILAYHWFLKNDGNRYLFAFTADAILKWDSGNEAWIWHCDSSITLTTATEWSVVTYNNKVVATNNQNKILVADDSVDFDELDSASGLEIATGAMWITKARFLKVFENMLWVFDVTYSSGSPNVFPHRGHWCDISDHEDWIEADSGPGSVDFGGEGHLRGAGLYRDFMMVFKQRGVHKVWLSAYTDLVFETAVFTREYGSDATHSIVNDKRGDLFFFASDKTIREIQRGVVSDAIEKTLRNVPDSLIGGIQAAAIDEYSELWWAIPEGPDATGNNEVLVMSADGTWQPRDHAVAAFGNYETQATYTWDTLPYASWDEWAWDRWDSIENKAGFPLDIGADYAGKTYTLHNSHLAAGSSFTGKLVLATDLTGSQRLGGYKRLLKIQLWLRRETGNTVDLYLKRDSESSWQAVSTGLSLTGNKNIIVLDVPCDYRAREYQFKIEATNHFRFLGAIFQFVLGGTR